jgi:hypothetical protein
LRGGIDLIEGGGFAGLAAALMVVVSKIVIHRAWLPGARQSPVLGARLALPCSLERGCKASKQCMKTLSDTATKNHFCPALWAPKTKPTSPPSIRTASLHWPVLNFRQLTIPTQLPERHLPTYPPAILYLP